jgi:hypothetical protein
VIPFDETVYEISCDPYSASPFLVVSLSGGIVRTMRIKSVTPEAKSPVTKHNPQLRSLTLVGTSQGTTHLRSREGRKGSGALVALASVPELGNVRNTF